MRTLSRRSGLLSAVCLTALALAAPLFAQTGAAGGSLWLEERLPAEKTLAFLQVEPYEGVLSRFEGTDLGELWTEIAPFRKELEAGLTKPLEQILGDLEKKSGFKVQALLDALGGGMSVGALNLGEAGAEPRPAVVLAFSKSAAATVKKGVEKLKKEAGEDLPPVTVTEGDMTIVTIFAGPEVLLERGAPGALSDDPGFRALRKEAWGTETTGAYFLYGNTAAALALVPSDPETDNLKAALGIEGLEAFGVGLGFERGQMREAFSLRTQGERQGILQLLQNQKPLSISRLADRVPSDVMSVAFCSLDLHKLWQDALKIAEAINPGTKAEAYDALLEAEAELGFSVPEALQAFGGTWVIESRVPEGGLSVLPEMVISVSLRDAAKVQLLLKTLADLGGFEEKQITQGGVTVHYLLAPLGKLGDEPFRGMREEQAGMLLAISSVAKAWTIKNRRLYLASAPSAIFGRFQRLKKASLSESESFKRAMASVRGGERMFAYSRPDRAAGPVYHVLLTALRFFEPVLRSAGIPVDTALLPSPKQVAARMGTQSGSWRITGDAMTFSVRGGVPASSVGVVAGLGAAFYLGLGQGRGEPRGAPASAFETMRSLVSAQEMYRVKNGRYAASLDELIANDLIKPEAVFSMPFEFQFEKGDAKTFRIVAHPYQRDASAVVGTPDGVHRLSSEKRSRGEKGGPESKSSKDPDPRDKAPLPGSGKSRPDGK